MSTDDESPPDGSRREKMSAEEMDEPAASQESVQECDSERTVKTQGDDSPPPRKSLPADMYYDYDDLHSRAFITADSDIPENLLHFLHSFGYDSGRRSNLHLLDDKTVIYMAGNLAVLLDVSTRQHKFLRSCSGGGIGSVAAHPSKEYFAVAEKGHKPNIIVYEYPSLRPYRILRGGAELVYNFVDFNPDGSLLVSVSSAPDYMVTLWNWREEEVTLSSKTISKDVYKMSFSPYISEMLTSSGLGHIKFWKMANSFTGLKLQGLIGHFGNTAMTDIEGFVQLPDGKVVSGSEWGNLLLWDGNTIKVEICRKGGRHCHLGNVQPFDLEDGQLMTMGSDGVIRGWDYEVINSADSSSQSNKFEMEPMNEIVVGHNVSLSSVVKSPVTDSFIRFAQDSHGAIWKLDLSFSSMTPDPECLFTFHAGAIRGLDVSRKSYLMATTALDGSIRVSDFLVKRELTNSHFNQGGTAVVWAPPFVSKEGGLLATGFEDGVVRLLELFDPRRLHGASQRSTKGDAELRLAQAFKPHNAPVTAFAYELNGKILATGSSDCTVFFFTVGEKYDPIGFVSVPGPVQKLQWSPHPDIEDRLLILCKTGHVVEVHCPDSRIQVSSQTFLLQELPRRHFRFRSIKSRIKRDEEIARRKALKEKRKKEREEWADQDEEEEEEEALPSIYIPSPPSPLNCGFYSQGGQFWLAMGGYDAGFLYHCKFSEKQHEDPDQHRDEPFACLPIDEADDDPICSVTFSSDGQLLLCGMHSGSVRIYPLQPGDHLLSSVKAYWQLSVHDNHNGHLQHICCSHDDSFVLTAGDDGNIFSFTRLHPAELEKSLQKHRVKVPPPRFDLDSEALAPDIDDPAADSIETVRQKQDEERLRREADKKKAAKRKKLAEVQKKFKHLLNENQNLQEHVRLTPEEVRLDQRFIKQAEEVKQQQVLEARKQLAWEKERCCLALDKIRNWFKDSLEPIVTVVGIDTDHRVSTYRVPAIIEPSAQHKEQMGAGRSDGDGTTALDRRKSRADTGKDSSEIEEEKEELRPLVSRPAGIKLAERQIERLRKAEEKAKQARDKIEKRKQEWQQFFAAKPKEDCEDPRDVQAIRDAKENIGDLKLKSAKDFKVPKHLRMNSDRKRDEMTALEENIREKQMAMNRQILALRDSKVSLVAEMQAEARQLRKVHKKLAPHLRRPPPSLPVILPEETPEKRLSCSRAALERYRALREEKGQGRQQQEQLTGGIALLEQLEKDLVELERKEEEDSAGGDSEDEETPCDGVESSELEEELKKEKEIRLLHMQDSLLDQMERSVCLFDARLLMLHHRRLKLDWLLKVADLRHMTLYQELLLLKEDDRREESLQENLNERMTEEHSITSKLEECQEELELRRREIAKVQEREKALVAALQASLGEDNKFEEYLTKVFKKRVKRKPQGREEEGGEDSDEDSDWDSDSDDDDDDEDDWVDDRVCPAGCDPELFESTLALRERRLDLEDMLVEKKKSASGLERECDILAKKLKIVKTRRKAAEDDVELVKREKQQKMNELDVAVALRLHQVEFLVNGTVPSDLTSALLLTRTELNRLQERVTQLQAEKKHQRDLFCQARHQHVRLIRESKEMDSEIRDWKEQCDKMMMMKFGRQVDIEALQTLSGNRTLEELKCEKLLQEATYTEEIRKMDVKVEAAHDALTEVNKCITGRMVRLTGLYDERKELELKLNDREGKIGKLLQLTSRSSDREDIARLQKLVKKQSQQVKVLRREISLLYRKGGHILPSVQAPLPPISPRSTPAGQTHETQQRPQAAGGR